MNAALMEHGPYRQLVKDALYYEKERFLREGVLFPAVFRFLDELNCQNLKADLSDAVFHKDEAVALLKVLARKNVWGEFVWDTLAERLSPYINELWSGDGVSPLTEALCSGSHLAVKHLIFHGANPYIEERDGKSPASRALSMRTVETKRLAFSSGNQVVELGLVDSAKTLLSSCSKITCKYRVPSMSFVSSFREMFSELVGDMSKSDSVSLSPVLAHAVFSEIERCYSFLSLSDLKFMKKNIDEWVKTKKCEPLGIINRASGQPVVEWYPDRLSSLLSLKESVVLLSCKDAVPPDTRQFRKGL